MDLTYYWSRFPGKFVVQTTGQHFPDLPFKFSGSPREWYELLVETINACINQLNVDATSASGQISKRDINVYVPPGVSELLRSSVLFRSDPLIKSNESVGRISDWMIYVDPTLLNDTVKIIASFNCYKGHVTLSGWVKILDMPENGRKV